MDIVFQFAYLDPGTGSLIIQSLIGAIAGVAVFGRRMLLGLKMKFKKGDKPSDTGSAGNTDKAAADKPNKPDDTAK